MDITEKINLIKKPPTQEIITENDLIDLLNTNKRPKHYIGLEISGFLHLGSLITIGLKINDFIKAGIKCNVFLADWHTVINNKLGSLSDIKIVSEYYVDAFRLICPKANIIFGSDIYESLNTKYWHDVISITKHMSLARTIRTITIMGRTQKSDQIDLAKLLYPPMQATDIHVLDVDIVHAGMDQRKIHVLIRDIFPKLKWKMPVSIHHRLLPGLTNTNKTNHMNKMSKSNIASGIFIHDSNEEIINKINKTWCDVCNENNPILEITKNIICHEFNEINIERNSKFGGNITYNNYNELENDFINKKLHPRDLKIAVSGYLINIIKPIREKLKINNEIIKIINR